jgi:hypothetical protein
MLQVITTNPTPPQVPPDFTSINAIGPRGQVNVSFSDVVKAIQSLYKWAQKENTWLNQYCTQVSQSVNTSISTFGVPLASASSIRVTEALHHVTGSAAISTINYPPNFAGGPIWLVADGMWTLTTGGNIAASANPNIGDVVVVVLDPVTKIWYPAAEGSGGSSSNFINVLVTTSTFNVPATGNYFIIANANANAVTINLPPATGSSHDIVVWAQDVTHLVAISPNGTDTINGVNSNVDFDLQYDAVRTHDALATTWAIW